MLERALPEPESRAGLRPRGRSLGRGGARNVHVHGSFGNAGGVLSRAQGRFGCQVKGRKGGGGGQEEES